MEAKERWINETIESIDGIGRAKIPSVLEKRILERAEGKIVSIRPVVKWIVAASIALLATLNFVSAIEYRKSSSVGASQTNPVYKEYFSFINNDATN